MNAYCRAHNIRFVMADVRGVFSWTFVDFGPKFSCGDANGETETSSLIESIELAPAPEPEPEPETSGEAAAADAKTTLLVMLARGKNSQLQDGDKVLLTELVSGRELIRAQPQPNPTEGGRVPC